MKHYLYRLGDGNDGNYPRAVIELSDDQCPYAALRAIVIDRYVPNSRIRRHIIKHIDVDGEPEFGIYATVYEGPDGEQAFGAAWITAEFEPIKPDDLEHCQSRYDILTIPECLDRGARVIYRKHA